MLRLKLTHINKWGPRGGASLHLASCPQNCLGTFSPGSNKRPSACAIVWFRNYTWFRIIYAETSLAFWHKLHRSLVIMGLRLTVWNAVQHIHRFLSRITGMFCTRYTGVKKLIQPLILLNVHVSPPLNTSEMEFRWWFYIKLHVRLRSFRLLNMNTYLSEETQDGLSLTIENISLNSMRPSDAYMRL